MSCFKRIYEKYLAESSTQSSGSNVFGIEVPKNIDNSCLLSNDFTLFQTLIQTPQTKQKFEQNNYTDKVLREDIEIDKDYIVVSKEMFKYLIDTLGYECSDVISR